MKIFQLTSEVQFHRIWLYQVPLCTNRTRNHVQNYFEFQLFGRAYRTQRLKHIESQLLLLLTPVCYFISFGMLFSFVCQKKFLIKICCDHRRRGQEVRSLQHRVSWKILNTAPSYTPNASFLSRDVFLYWATGEFFVLAASFCSFVHLHTSTRPSSGWGWWMIDDD